MFSSLKAKVDTKDASTTDDAQPGDAQLAKPAAAAASGTTAPPKSGGKEIHALDTI